MLLVTGITGHTGRYFYEELNKNRFSDKIRIMVRESSDLTFLNTSSLDIEVFKDDINNKEAIDRAMQNVTEVVHIYNIHNSIDILNSAIKHGVKKVVLVHTTGIYSNFKDASARYKEIEAEINSILEKNKDIDVIIVRPSMIYGDLCDKNMSKFIKMISKLKVVPVIDGGKSYIQPVNARDLGKAYYTVLKNINGQKAYDLTGDRPIQLREAYNIIAKALGKKIFIVNIPLSLGLFVSKTLKALTLGKIDVIEKVQRMTEDRSYSHEQAKIDFNYAPITFEDGIKFEVNQFINK